MVGYGGPRESGWLEAQGIIAVRDAPAELMPAVFGFCDIYVTASRWEGFDLPLAEAQSFGKPVVALDAGAHPEVVADGKSGFLVNGMEELTRAVEALATDPEMRAFMGRAALEQAERFKWENAVTAYERVLGEVTGGAGR